jgi:FkbM family methyltransferase
MQSTLIIKKPKSYFADIIDYFLQGNLSAAFARGRLPLISLFNCYLDKLRYTYIIFKNRIHAEEIIVKVNDLYNMQLNLRDWGICKDLSIHKKREFFSTDYFKEICNENSIYIDIGANIGYYALLESSLSPKGRVYAIEPVPQNFDLLKKNIELNNRRNVQLFKCAIGDVNGNSPMYVNNKCNWCSFTKDLTGNSGSTITVPVVTLDEFVDYYMDKSPNFIRMDVEGFEINILKGALRTLNSIAPMIICIELHPHLMSKKDTMACVEILKGSGFKVKLIIRETDTYEYKSINIINKLRDILNWPLYGYYGDTYDVLEQLLSNKCSAMVFFEKK